MGINKITVDGVTKINLEQTGIESSADIPAGKYGYLRTGELVLGTGEIMSNPLSGKILAVTGDSICEGAGYTGGYAGIIGEEQGMTVQNIAQGGGRIVSSSGIFGIGSSISNLRSDADYVILEGGGNDAGNAVTVGTLTSGFSDSLNTNTFAGAFEDMLKSAITRFPNKKLGYVMIHKCFPGFTSLSGDDAYYSVAKQACEKWGIPFLDLSILVPPLADVSALAQAYTQDGYGVHPNEQGYRLFYVPKITAWMKTL